MALKNCQPFYARFCKVIRIEPLQSLVRSFQEWGEGWVGCPYPLILYIIPPPPPPHPLLPNLTYNGFWPWNLAFSGSLFLVISRKCHRNFKVVTFPKVANSLPVCQWTTKLNPGFCPSSEKFNIIILKLRQTRKTEKCRQIKKGGGVFVWAIKST